MSFDWSEYLNLAQELAGQATGPSSQEAKLRSAVSRAYYAAFYAATALLLGEGLDFGKHSGVIAAVHQKYVRTGRLEKRYGKDLNWLFELRGVGDYGVKIHVPNEEADKAIEVAEDFVEAIKLLMREIC